MDPCGASPNLAIPSGMVRLASRAACSTWRPPAHRAVLPSGLDHAVRVDDELLRRPLVKVAIALCGPVERYGRHVARLGDLDLIVQNGHHELAVVLHDRALSGG